LNALERAVDKVGNMYYWSKVPLPKYMCAKGQEVLRPVDRYPNWENNAYKNLSPDPSKNCSPCRYVVTPKEVTSDDSTPESVDPCTIETEQAGFAKAYAWCPV